MDTTLKRKRVQTSTLPTSAATVRVAGRRSVAIVWCGLLLLVLAPAVGQGAELQLVPELGLLQGFTDRSLFTAKDQDSAEAYTTFSPGLGIAAGFDALRLGGRVDAALSHRTRAGQTLFGGGGLDLGWTASERIDLSLGYHGAIGETIGAQIPQAVPTVTQQRSGSTSQQSGVVLISGSPGAEQVVTTQNTGMALRFGLDPVSELRMTADGSYRRQSTLHSDSSAIGDYAVAGGLAYARALGTLTNFQLRYEAGAFFQPYQQSTTTLFQGALASLRRGLSERLDVGAFGGMRVVFDPRQNGPLYEPVGGLDAVYRWPLAQLRVSLDRSVLLDTTLGGTTTSYNATAGLGYRLLTSLELGVGMSGSWAQVESAPNATTAGTTSTLVYGMVPGETGYVDYTIDAVVSWRFTRDYQASGRYVRIFTVPLPLNGGANDVSFGSDSFELALVARWG